ncbi:MAG: UbiD family decarboxylase [Chloroflexota bacterium]
MFRDLREFIEAVDRLGELRRINGADPRLEMGTLNEVAAESSLCPMLLYDNIRGYPAGYRVAANLLNTPRRLALVLGLPTDLQGIDFVRAWKDKVRFEGGVAPVRVKEARFEENVFTGDEVNIRQLPSPTWHEHDGGEYFGTGAITLVRDPDSGYVNYGVYRLQTHAPDTLLIQPRVSSHFSTAARKYWSKGQNCPVAVACGIDPTTWLAGVFPSVPFGLSEYEVAGHLRGGPVEVVEGELTGLPIPATAEIALEGEVLPPQSVTVAEGPLGEFTGYYSGEAQPAPVIKIRRLMYRHNPVMHAAPPMKPLPGLYYLGINWRSAIIWRDLERAGMSGIKGVWQHGASLTIISLQQQYPGHAKQVGLTAAASRSTDIVRFIVVLDDDVDPSNISEVFWAMSTRCEPAEIDILRGAYCGIFDPRIPPEKRETGDLTGSKAVIDACRPYYWRDRFPRVNEVSAELKAEAREKWGKALGL